MLEDNFGRRFHYLRLSITDVCNFKCTYCLPDGYQNEESKHFLTLPEIKKVAATFAKLGTSKVRITGGEPALRKDLPDIISAINNTSGIDKVAITTNGYKLSTQIDDWVGAGLDALNVSIDSLNPHMFRQITGHNKLDEIMKGIERGFTLGLSQIKVNAVLMKQYNANEFSAFLDWIKETPVTLRFIELMQTGDNIEFFQKNHVSGSLLQQSLEQQGWQRVEREIHAGPAIEYSHPNYAGRVGLIMPYSPNFCKSFQTGFYHELPTLSSVSLVSSLLGSMVAICVLPPVVSDATRSLIELSLQ